MKKMWVLLFLVLYSLSLRSIAMSLLSIESPAFLSNTVIPSQYTCDGANDSPPLLWQDAASNTQSYVLIVDDPDAPSGVWDHWVLLNIPANTRQLAAGTQIPNGAVNGKNSWGAVGYRGPCPPNGAHRYFFKLYALDTVLNLSDAPTKNEVEQAMQGHVIANSELIGLYR
ncbi:MAG: YbhB/YbcL family Raf kinase inhibitor-like protein [Legionellales bacterium]